MGRKNDRNTYVFDGTNFHFAGEEDELGPDDWLLARKEAFSKLKGGGIPEEIVDLVENFKERSLVRLFPIGRDNEKGALKFGVSVVSDPANKGTLTASEALAILLRIRLRSLKSHGLGAPVRRFRLLPRSLISGVAFDLLESCKKKIAPRAGIFYSY